MGLKLVASTYFTNLLEPYQPQLPVDQLVVELNNLYHGLEAQNYDIRHPEVHKQLPPLWQEMIERGVEECKSGGWRILDFGCGTGFEAEQVLRNLPRGNVVQLTCYDPSPEMLNRCCSRVAPLFPEAEFCSDLSTLLSRGERCYNLLATNSLLHHLPDPVSTINRLLALFDHNSVWLAGHEPSNRFYKNLECLKVYRRFLREHRWRKILSPRRYLKRLRLVIGLEPNLAQKTAEEALRRGFFKKRPPVSVIGKLVDFNVPHSPEEVALGRGFNFEMMHQDFAGAWDLAWVKTYSFMGPFYEGHLPEKWIHLCRELAQSFPKDGANFCAVWKRS
jgi:SAM-dependent methyltransferase